MNEKPKIEQDGLRRQQVPATKGLLMPAMKDLLLPKVTVDRTQTYCISS